MKQNYYTVKSLIEAAVDMAKADPLYATVLEKCPLEYGHFILGVDEVELTSSEFEAVGTVHYGGSEGVYGEIRFFGIRNSKNSLLEYAQNMYVYSLKTRLSNKEAYLGMGRLVMLICYYINHEKQNNLWCFD